MSEEDGAALAHILESAGQRAEEIRVEIASLKEKTGNAVTVPQLLKGDAKPDVAEPAEVVRPDEPDSGLQFTVCTPSGERQAPPKTEDGTDTEDLERAHGPDGSLIQVYVRSHSSLAMCGRTAEALRPGPVLQAVPAAVLTTSSEASTEAAAQPEAAGTAGQASWQGLYQDMIGKLNKSQCKRQQGHVGDEPHMLQSAGMASAVDTSSCNVPPPQMATPFARDSTQAAAVAAGAIASQQPEAAADPAMMLPSPVHVLQESYTHSTDAAVAAAAAAQSTTAAAVASECAEAASLAAEAANAGAPESSSSAEAHDQWTPVPGWLMSTPEPHSSSNSTCDSSKHEARTSGGGSNTCPLYEAGSGVQQIIVPASAADLPVQAVLQELDELLSLSTRSPAHQQHNASQHLFAPSPNSHAAEAGQKHQASEAVTAGNKAAVGDSEQKQAGRAVGQEQQREQQQGQEQGQEEGDDWVLRWLKEQKGQLSRRNSTSCLLSDEYMHRSGRSSTVSSEQGRPRRSSSVPLPSEPQNGRSAGGADVDDDATNDKGAKMRQHQEESGGGLKDEILAHLRLAAAFRAQPHEGNSSSLEPFSSTPAEPAEAAAAAQRACAVQEAVSSNKAPETPQQHHGVSLVDWMVAGKYIGAMASCDTRTGSSLGVVAAADAHMQAATAAAHAAGSGVDAVSKPMMTTFSIAGAAGAVAADADGTRSPLSGIKAPPAAVAEQPVHSPKALSKSAQLYQQLLMRPLSAAGGSSKGSSAGGRSRQGSRAGGVQQPTSGSPLRCPAPSAAGTHGCCPCGNEQASMQMPATSATKQHSNMAPLYDSQQHPEHPDGAAVKCTACGSPMACGRSANKLQQSHMRIVDLAAEATVEQAVVHGTASGGAEAGKTGIEVAAPAVAAITMDPTAPVGTSEALIHARASLAALMTGENGAGCNSEESLGCSNAARTPSGLGPEHSRAAAQKAAGCAAAPTAARASFHSVVPAAAARKQASRPLGYAASASARQSSVYCSSTAGHLGGYATARQSGVAAGPEREGRQPGSHPRMSSGQRSSVVGTAVGAADAADDVPPGAMVTAISCGQLLAAAALEQAMGRVSAAGSSCSAGCTAGESARAAELDTEARPHSAFSSGRPSLAGTAVAAADQQDLRQASRPSLSGLLQLERDMEEQALEDEIARLKCSSSAGKAPNVFVYRLQPTNEAGSASLGGAAPAVVSSTVVSAAATAALQTLAAAASRKGGTRPASLSPSRMTSIKSMTADGKRSSSTDPQPRGSSSVSRSSSTKSGLPCANSGAGSRVWRPSGNRTSAKDDSRKLKDYESARSRILGPVTDSDGGSASAAVDALGAASTSHSSSKAATPKQAKPSAFGRSNSPPKRPAGARVAAAVAAIQGAAGGAADVKAAPATKPASTAKVAAVQTGAAARNHLPTKAGRAAAAAKTVSTAQAAAQARVAAARAAAAAGRSAAAAAAAGATVVSRTKSPAGRCRSTAAPRAREMHEQAVQADMGRDLAAMDLPEVPQLFDDPCSLLDDLKGRLKHTSRQSTPGRLQTPGRLPIVVPPAQQLHQPSVLQQASPTTSKVEEAIKAAQVALLQRRWQISQLRKIMVAHGIHSGAGGSRSARSSTGNSLNLNISSSTDCAGSESYSSKPCFYSRTNSKDTEAAAAAGPGFGAPAGGSYASQAAAVAALIKQQRKTSSAEYAAADIGTDASISSGGAAQKSAAAAASQPSPGPAAAPAAASRPRPSSALDLQLKQDAESPRPVRPSSAQAMVATHAHHSTVGPATEAAAAAAASTHFVAAPPLSLGAGLGSRRASCHKHYSPRRRSSVGSPTCTGVVAAGPAPAPAAWSAPKRVSSSGLTGEELMAYYRRSSATEAAEVAEAAAHADAEVPPTVQLQLDAMLRAYHALSRRKHCRDKSAALAALMAQIVAVASVQALPGQAAAANRQAGTEPAAGSDLEQLLCSKTSEEDCLAGEGSMLDVLGRGVSPQPAAVVSSGSVLQTLKADMLSGWQSSSPERQAAHDSLLSTPAHKRPGSCGYAADLAAITAGSSHGHAGVKALKSDQQDPKGDDGLSPKHSSMLQHAVAQVKEVATTQSSCTGIPAGAFAAAADGSGIVVVHTRTTEVARRLALRDTATGRAVLAGIDGTTLTVQQAVHWLKVGLTRLDQGIDQPAAGWPVSPGPGTQVQMARPTRTASPIRGASSASPSRARARSRPCSPFRACFAPAQVLSDEEEEIDEDSQQQQQQQQQLTPKQDGVQFEMDSDNQLVMVLPKHLTGEDGVGGGASVQKYTVTGVALPAGGTAADAAQQGAAVGGYTVELVTCAGRHRIELASSRDWAGLLAGLNAMLLLREQSGDAEKLGATAIADTIWSASVEGVSY